MTSAHPAHEAGETTPDDDKIQMLARVLNFPPAFFSTQEVELLSPETASSHRSFLSFPAFTKRNDAE